MAEAGRSLKPFYLLLGAIAVVGGVLIAVYGGGTRAPALASADCQTLAPGLPAKGVTLGPDSAKIEIVEYSDFQCPWCARFSILTEPDIRQKLLPTGLVKWRYMNYPLTEIHANTGVAHLAAACALEQGKFWEMHDALYLGQNDWGSDRNPMRRILEYATRIGLNADSLRECITSRRPWPEIQAEKCSGLKLGVNGTPTFFINGRQLPDIPVYDDFRRMVDSITAATATTVRPSSGRGR